MSRRLDGQRCSHQGCRDLDKIILDSRVTFHFSILGLEKTETYFSVSILDRINFLDLHILVENKAKWHLMSLGEWNEMLLIERVINFTKATLNVQDYDLSETCSLFKNTFRWWLSGDSRPWRYDLNSRPVENILSTSQLVGLKLSLITIL